MTFSAVLSLIKLNGGYALQLQLPETMHGLVIVAAMQTLSHTAEASLHEQINRTVRQLNAQIVFRTSHVEHTGSARYQTADSSETDPLLDLGRLIYTQVLPSPIQRALRDLPAGTPLIIATNTNVLPWELLHDGDEFLALKHVVSRAMVVNDVPNPPFSPVHSQWQALLIGDPTEDLPASRHEIKQLESLLRSLQGTTPPRMLMMSRATRETVLRELSRGIYDLIHYAGHVHFDPRDPSGNGLVLAGKEVLTAGEIAQHARGQPVVFLNGCASARMSDVVTTPANPVSLGDVESSTDQLSYFGSGINTLVSAFAMAGARSVVGTYWPVHDAHSQVFAQTYYQAAIARGEPTGAALRHARAYSKSKSASDLQWASYVLFGDPSAIVRPISGAGDRLATVLVARWSNDEPLVPSTNARPGETAEVIDALVSVLAAQVTQFGGQIHAVTHNMLVAAFGVVSAQQNDAERAVLAALGIHTAFDQLRDQYKQRASELSLRVGLSSGHVLVRASSPNERDLGVLIGEPVQEALLLSGQAEAGEVLVADSVRRMIWRMFELEPKPTQTTFDRATADTDQSPLAYRVVGTISRSRNFWRMVDEDAKFVGRADELRTLRAMWAATRVGQGHIVDIVGEAGVGKSRLLYEFHRLISDVDVRWLLAASPSAYTPRPYWLIGEVLRNGFDWAGTQSAALTLEKIEDSVRALFDRRLVEHKFAEMVAVLENCLDLGSTYAAYLQPDPKVRQRQLVSVLGRLLAQGTIQRPAIIVLEDVHAADEASLDMLHQLLPTIEHLPVLVLALARTSADEGTSSRQWQPPWQRWPNRREIHLTALNEAESRDLLAALLQTEHAPDDIAEIVLPACHGDPLWMRELVISLQERRVLTCHTGKWRMTTRSVYVSDLPDTLQRVIWSRIEALPAPAQRLLTVLSVIGDAADVSLLHTMLQRAGLASDLEEGLVQLQAKGFIVPTWRTWEAWGDDAYAFKHTLVQSEVYSRLRGEERRRLHQLAGQALEQIYAERGHEHAQWVRLAYHFYSSLPILQSEGTFTLFDETDPTLMQKAAEYLARAGSQANRHYAPRQALEHYGRALNILRLIQPPPRDAARRHADYAMGLGDAHDMLSDYGSAIAAYESAFAQLRDDLKTSADRRRAADLLRRIGRSRGWGEGASQPIVYMHQALDVLGSLESDEDRATAALIHTHIGTLHGLESDFEAAKLSCLKSLELLDSQPDSAVAATTLKVLGVMYDLTGDWSKSVEASTRSLQIWEALGDQREIALVKDNLGTIHFNRGDFHLAEQAYQASLEFWRLMEDADGLANATLNIGSIYLIRGDLDAAEHCIRKSLASFERSGNRGKIALTHNNLGLLAIARDNLEQARSSFLQSIALDESAENVRGLAETELLSALTNKESVLDVALQHAQCSLTLAQDHKLGFELGLTHRVLARIHAALGHQTMTYQHLQESLRIMRELGARYEIGRTLYELVALVQESDPERQLYRQEALSIFTQVGAQPDLTRMRRLP